MPDYLGFGDPDMAQLHYIPRAEGRVLLDAIRAVEQFLEERDTQVRPQAAFLPGHFQGGHAAFAAADLYARYSSELALLGVMGYAPTTSVEAVLPGSTVVAPMMVRAYSEYYGADKVDPQATLADRWLTTEVEDVTTMCIDAIQQYYPLSPEPLYAPVFS